MKKNYLYNLILSVSNILFPILSFPYASRILGPIGIGKVQLSTTLAQYFGLIAALGIPIYGIQEIAKYRHNKEQLSKVFSELFGIYFLNSIAVAILYFVIINIFPFFHQNYTMYIYAGVIVLFAFTTLDWVYAGLEQYRIITIRSIIIKAIALLLLYLLVHDSGDAIYFLIITIFSMMGNNLISLYFIRKQAKIRLQNLEFKKHLKPLFYIFATTMAASIYTYLDILLLGFLSTETAVGYYTAAIKLTKIAIPFITAAGFVLIPKFAIQSYNNNEQSIQALLEKSWHYIVFFSVPISIGLFSLAKEFILVFSGDEFTQAIPTMQLLSMLPFLIGLGYFFAFQVLVPMGRSKEMFYAVLVGMCVSLILNFMLIPLYQANGTAITILFTEIVVTSLYFYFVSKYFSYRYDWILVLKSCISCVFFIPIAIIIRQLNLNNTIVLFVAIGASALSYFCIQYFIFKDKYFKQILKDIQHKLFNSIHE